VSPPHRELDDERERGLGGRRTRTKPREARGGGKNRSPEAGGNANNCNENYEKDEGEGQEGAPRNIANVCTGVKTSCGDCTRGVWGYWRTHAFLHINFEEKFVWKTGRFRMQGRDDETRIRSATKSAKR